MGLAERKERHKEDLRKEILEAAKQLFTEKGFEATSIRAIAEKIEYSPATRLYTPFTAMAFVY
jgi:AcrR family transcriptional regulator